MSIFRWLFGGGSAAENPRVDGAKARALLAEGALLLDVRSPAEVASGAIGGATNIPLDQLPQRLSELPEGKPIVVYCASGMRSARAAALLRGAGVQAWDLGSIRNW